jgi:hypothetical protein
MSASVQVAPRILAVLKLPQRRVPLLLSIARSIVMRMTDNAWFPAPDPPLAEVQSAIDDLTQAATTAATRVLGSVPARDAKREVLVVRLGYLRDYVQAIANANLDHAVAIIESAGMSVKKVGRPPPPTHRLARGRVSGQVDIVVPSAADRAAYEHQYSLDGGKTWLPLPQPFTNETKVTVAGLPPGATVMFRYRASVKGVVGDWSDVLSIVVE